MKTAQERRLVIAFFSGSNDQAKQATATMRRLYPREEVSAFFAGDPPSASHPYSHLKLPDESLLLVWIDVSELSTAIHTLQAARARSIFLTAAPAPGTPPEGCPVIGETVRDSSGFLRTIDSLQKAVAAAREYLVESVGLGHTASPAAQWVMDNAYLVQIGLKDIRKEVHIAVRRMPGPGLTALLDLAQRFADQSGFRVSDEALRHYLTRVQLDGELDSGQLWSFPLMVRFVLMQQLTELACRCSRTQLLRETAFLWADRITQSSAYGGDALGTTIQKLQAEPFAADRSFAIALAEQLQEQETALQVLQESMEQRLGAPLSEIVRAEHEREAADSLLAANAFGSLRVITQIEFKNIFEGVSLSDAELRKDPAGIYPRSDFATRDRCRQVIAALARRTAAPESQVARMAVGLAENSTSAPENNVLHYLMGDGIRNLERILNTRATASQRILRWLRRRAVPVYLTSIFLLTGAFTAIALTLAWDAGIRDRLLLALLGSLAALPLSELAIQILHSLVVTSFPPEPLPKMDYEAAIGADVRTLVVVPMMLSSKPTIREELKKLEIRFLANRQDNLTFSLFADFTDAPERTQATDASFLEEAKQGIRELNARYGENRFVLFHRPRVWSESEQAWIGRERKRGKIEELNAFLCGEGPADIVAEGNVTHPVRFVITLDADTQLPPGSAVRLIETISHPMNRVEIDPHTGIRRSGYTIIQPRVSIALPGASATRFTQIVADAQGTDPYCTAVSDAHQDLFREAMFHGKAIYDVTAFHQIMAGRFPPETVLSHDLIEGAHVGVGLASDIELLENVPIDYPTFAARQHRWIRGDWQIAAWCTGKVRDGSGKRRDNPLSVLNRWRILDNLRRSLVPMASLLLLGFGWFVSAAPEVWTLVLALAIVTPALVPVLDRWSRHLERTVYGWQGAAGDLKRAAIALVFLPHQAWLNTDAIVRVFHRTLISRRKLLEWKAAGDASDHNGSRNATFRQMLVVSAASSAALLLLAMRGAFEPTFVFLGLWITAPWVMRWLAGRDPRPWRQTIGHSDTVYLRNLARRTWRYFDDLVGPESNWLPPDNTQLALRVEVAQRTSPTNIGLWLNAALAARDFGYLTIDEFVRRCSLTFETVERLERYEGHLFNWYDTRRLVPLAPHYVSTVDSGNLIASLWVLSRGCREMADVPILDPFLAGLADSLEILRGHTGTDPSLAAALEGLRRAVRTRGPSLERTGQLRLASYYVAQLKETERWHAKTGGEMAYWAVKLAQEIQAWNSTLDRYLRWMEVLSRASDDVLGTLGPRVVEFRRSALLEVPTLRVLANGMPTGLAALLDNRALPELRPEIAEWLDAVAKEFKQAQQNATETLRQLDVLAATADRLADNVNMGFLYDPARRLFGIGYAAGGPMVFGSHYDLLASECRLGSLVAIAKGDLPVEHWFVLSRPRVSTPQRQALLSWSGTLFEYLMPVLYTEAFENSLLSQAAEKAVTAQVAYGARHDLPWGISECAYSALDSRQIYQYRAFGVPELALNPDADPGPVVAPYATALALMMDPGRALDNFRRLEGQGAMGSMGFYEAIDYTRPQGKDGKPGVVIFSYMAHHQAMTLLAVSNVLHRGIVQRRFHAEPRVRAVESLLFERIPISRVEAEEIIRTRKPPGPVYVQERVWTEPTAIPHVHLNSNGRYSVMVTNNGGGYSRWRGIDITRWRSDTACDPFGTCIWIRDVRSGAAWSPSWHPAGTLGEGSVTFAADRAEFRRRFQDLEARLEVAVATGDDAEVRRITLSNRSLRTRHVEISSYMNLVLAQHAADTAHPVFAKLFVETEAPERGVLIAHRRPRSVDEQPIWVGCVLAGASGTIECETDRAVFLGRGRDVTNPAFRGAFSGSAGAVLDPIFSFRCRLALEPRERREIALVTMAAPSREELWALIRKYQAPEALTYAYEMIWTRAQLEFRHLRIGASSAHRFQELAGHLLYPNARLRPSPARLERNKRGQPELWKYRISGDLPLLVVTAADMQAVKLIRELFLAHAYLRMRGLEVDFLIVNREEAGYQTPLQDLLTRLVQAHSEDRGADRSGKIHLLNWHDVAEPDRDLLLAAASVVLGGHLGPLQQQLMGTANVPVIPRLQRALSAAEETISIAPSPQLVHFNGFGGFSPDGREYVVELAQGVQTPLPWANVIANERFGTVLTESGLGFTWNGNSQRNRLTPWHNDPVSDPQSEVIYLRDEESRQFWTPTPLPIRESSSYRVRHGQGYSIFEHLSHGIAQHLTVFVARNEPVKICILRLTNQSERPRVLTATHIAEWVLGSVREQQQVHINSWYDPRSDVLLARQLWREPFEGHVAFASAGPAAVAYTADRIAFYGGASSPASPAGLEQSHLDNRSGGGLDPCAALQVRLAIPPGGTSEVVFVLGQAESEERALELARRFRDLSHAERELASVSASWDRLVEAIQVKTPLPTVDVLLNRWLLYQVLSCRIWARSAIYQSGGAIGFRDQLQDCISLAYCAPGLARAHILLAASRQFTSGDVQHWWHAESGLGVRTRCSDDLLWLPWAVYRYLERTGDTAILDEHIPFLDGPELDPGEMERLFVPAASSTSATLWEHCRRAIDRASRFGSHGLPLFGSGDWNDGMNRVAAEGRGESVWLAWFLLDILDDWIDLARRGEPALAARWRTRSRNLKAAVEQHAWDGEWYLRGYADDGSPLGSRYSSEARIDSLPQSWAVLSGHGDRERAAQAMASAEAQLVRPQEALVRLLTPPFDVSTPHPGYIMGYPPGVRENGGQYTHAALWLAQAHTHLTDGAAAVRLLQMMNPVERTLTDTAAAKYKGEPYAVAADVSSSPGRAGTCGWTWYTGSAGWMYRVWLEDVLGFHIQGKRLRIAPVIPDDWPGFEILYLFGLSRYRIIVERVAPGTVCQIERDGALSGDDTADLVDDGQEHEIRVRLGMERPVPVDALADPRSRR